MSHKSQKWPFVAVAVILVFAIGLYGVYDSARSSVIAEKEQSIQRGQFLTVSFDDFFRCQAEFRGVEISADSWLVIHFEVFMVSQGVIPSSDVPNLRSQKSWGLKEWDVIEGYMN